MKYNVEWLKNLMGNPKKRALPVLSFPSVSLLGVSVRELIADAKLQAAGMLLPLRHKKRLRALYRLQKTAAFLSAAALTEIFKGFFQNLLHVVGKA